MPTITFRCSDQVADWIRADAKRAGMTTTDFIIARVCGKPDITHGSRASLVRADLVPTPAPAKPKRIEAPAGKFRGVDALTGKAIYK